ncbi:Tellurite resistance protein TehA [Vibrio quintilis]|uniref:Tellurite resistance protein TehA n=3 Tax=Vibrio quintilis TaxID=1117707 RepID=A0A1M7YR35_9VIBR|nr:Tellurite resistance protein TehA [Vibrio quintilis]
MVVKEVPMNTVQTQPDTEATSRLMHFPVSFFAMVMGLSGLTIAWKTAGADMLPSATLNLGIFTSAIMLVISGIYFMKLVRYPQAVLDELHHPVRLNFFPAFSISLLLLSVVWNSHEQTSLLLWSAGTLIQFLMTLYVMNSWIHHTHYTLSHANPSWFIPVVGNVIVPISGVHLGFIELSWFFFSIGIVFWVVLMTMILYRLFFHEPLPARLTPMLFILLAPPSIGFISYSALTGGLDNTGRILYYIALFLSMLLLSNILRFIRIPFFISSWAYSFPLAALTIATTKMGHLLQSFWFDMFAKILLAFLSLLLLWLVVQTVKAIAGKKLCQPE